MSADWINQVKNHLLNQPDIQNCDAAIETYVTQFSADYIEKHSPQQAADDMLFIYKINDSHPIEIQLCEHPGKSGTELHIRLYQYNTHIHLSNILPIIDNFGFETLKEHSYEIQLKENITIMINDYTVMYNSGTLLVNDVRNNFHDAFISIFDGKSENDGFNKLIISAGLTWEEVTLLRAYAKYSHQTRFRFSQQYIENTLHTHADITKQLIEYFKLRHDPNLLSGIDEQAENAENVLKSMLEKVETLDDDMIIRRFWMLIKATVRTNYFQRIKVEKNNTFFSFKFRSSDIPELPLPHPLYEIYVYSPQFEGIHLRADKVARGGIRWSDRKEDFRTEILGLMKAQKVKNAIIIPSGAKGGFVLKNTKAGISRDELQDEVVSCYKQFISGLLSITDNIKNDAVIQPLHVRCHDENDTYLVVAADKGTATFSDIANEIAASYDFWLADAFASGGKTGYDHKKLGITARGAWESIKRHFQELDINLENAPITMIGIGDMSGDVFGNAVTQSKNIKLIAAFDHRHIFIDPSPDPEKSYNERLRLFKLPASSWEDYNPSLISAGGGIYSRTLKSITLSQQAQQALQIDKSVMTPNELIKAVLCAPVDLFFNGGIGTYVKASTESHDDVKDKLNEHCRVNGNELRCKVVVEGGNLGFTQLGRIEYALNAGLINTDFIDNSAGVDCSDHEVNLKILLNKLVQADQMTLEKRNNILASVENDIASLVLRDNAQQALVMSFSSYHSAAYSDLYQSHIKKLESYAGLSRSVEFLPDDKKILDRKAQGLGLTRPELAVLLAYTKIHVKNEILKSPLVGDPYLSNVIESAFPNAIYDAYHTEIYQHHLKNQIIATQMSNKMINKMGVTFIYRLQYETGASIANVTHAYMIAQHIFDSDNLQQQIESLDFKVPVKVQYELLHLERQLLNMATRWFLRNNRLQTDSKILCNYYKEKIKLLEDYIPNYIVGDTKNYQKRLAEQFRKAGLNQQTAQRFAISRVMYAALNIIEVATLNNFDLLKTAEVYFACGGKFNLVWFRDQLARDSREGQWNTMARLTLRDELDNLQRRLTILIINETGIQPNADEFINRWAENHASLFERWEDVLGSIQENSSDDYTLYFIAFRELNNLLDNIVMSKEAQNTKSYPAIEEAPDEAQILATEPVTG